MNNISILTPVAGSMLRLKNGFRCPRTAYNVREMFRVRLSQQYPSGRGIATTSRNRTLFCVIKKRQVQPWKRDLCAGFDATRNQFSTEATATVSDRDNEADEIHRYRYQLYKYKICPFSNIAKVFLEYQMIPFESVEVNPLTKAELGFSEKYRKVPIVTILDSASTTPASKAIQQLNGTEEILPHDYQLSESSCMMIKDDDDEFASSDSSIRWQDFARNKLAPLLYPNICRTLGDSFRAFDYVHSGANSFSVAQRYSIQFIGSVAMYFAASKIKEKYNIDDVQVALDELLAELESELSKEGSRFLRPAPLDLPHLGDLSVFGVLKGLQGLPLWYTIFDDDDTQLKYTNIRRWYANVESAVQTRKMQTLRYGFND
jgi:microsomal prostaglandin-E synthase 2